MRKLSKRQMDVFQAIEDYINVNGYSPSFRDLGGMLGIKSPSTISNHLDQLKSKGYITYIPGAPRTITIKNPPLKREGDSMFY